jgi:hypothetical protein
MIRVDLQASPPAKEVLQCWSLVYNDKATNMLALKKEPEMENSSSQLETRVTRLETHMEHMASNISRILEELKDLRTSTAAKFDQVNERIAMLHVSMSEKFGQVNEKFGEVNEKFGAMNEKFGEVGKQLVLIKVWALTVLGGGLGFGILTVIARAQHWI